MPPTEDTADGPYKGMSYANVHPLIGNLCIKPEGGVDVNMFLALQEELSLDDALDIIEMDMVSRSWHAASRANSRQASARKRPKGAR